MKFLPVILRNLLRSRRRAADGASIGISTLLNSGDSPSHREPVDRKPAKYSCQPQYRFCTTCERGVSNYLRADRHVGESCPWIAWHDERPYCSRSLHSDHDDGCNGG